MRDLVTVQSEAGQKLWPELGGGGERGEIPRQCLTFTVSPDSSEALLMCLPSSPSNVSHRTSLYGVGGENPHLSRLAQPAVHIDQRSYISLTI